MKTTLTLILLMACMVGNGQKKPVTDDVYYEPEETDVTAAIPKGTKILTVTTEKTADENFRLVTETLLDYNIEIENRDKELLTISTVFTPLPKTGSYKLKFRCKDKQVIVSGYFTSGISIDLGGVRSEDTASEIEKRGMKKSLYDISFKKMYDFALKLGTVTW